MQPTECYSRDLSRLKNLTLISHNLIKVPFLKSHEIEVFISNYVDKYNLRLSKQSISKIVDFSGGIPTILRNILRECSITKNLDIVLRSEEVVNIVNIFWNNFSEREQACLRSVFNGESVRNYSNEVKYLKSFNILNQDDDLVGKWLGSILNRERVNKLRIKQNLIFMDEINVSKNLSKDESRILFNLLQVPNNYLPKERIMAIKWGDNIPSEWALHKFMARLRTRLNNLGLADDIIKNVKGKGYKLIN